MRIRLFGRRYDLRAEDMGYAIQKAFVPMVRGALWELRHLRRPTGLMLGSGTQVLSARRLQLGRGVFIGRHSYVEAGAANGARIGAGVSIRENAWIQCRSGLNERAKSLTIGAGTYLGPMAVIGVGGAVVIGEGCQIGARLSVAAESHVMDGALAVGTGVSRRGITIGDNCWIGNDVTILDGVSIGANTTIGAKSLVLRDIPAGSVAYGVPARAVSTT